MAVPLRYQLTSGDTIEIVTTTRQTPSKDWLKIVTTTLTSGRAAPSPAAAGVSTASSSAAADTRRGYQSSRAAR